jgi:hypothetical protein
LIDNYNPLFYRFAAVVAARGTGLPKTSNVPRWM